MTNDEIRMTNEIPNSKFEIIDRQPIVSSFDVGIWSFIRHSSFEFRHFVSTPHVGSIVNSLAGFISGRREAATHRVFGDGARNDELQQIIGSAGFAADARKFESAERLAGDQCAGNRSV